MFQNGQTQNMSNHSEALYINRLPCEQIPAQIQQIPKTISNGQKAVFAARFLKCACPFWEIMH